MKRSGRVKWSELRVGIVLLFAFALLLWAAFTGSGFTVFTRTNSLVAYFPEVNGLMAGAPVWMAGLEVGHIDGITFVEKDGRIMVRVDFRVRRRFFPMINTDATVSVSTMGLMGDKYLDIRLGRSGAPPIAPGAQLDIVRSTDLTHAFSGAPDMVERVRDAVAQLSAILERINRGEGFLGRLTVESESSANLDSLVISAREFLADINASQKKLTKSLQETSRKLNALADAVEHGDGSLARLVKDTALYVNISSLTARAEKLLRRLEEGEGAVGKLMADDAMYDDVRVLLADLEALIADIKKNPKKYFKFSLF